MKRTVRQIADPDRDIDPLVDQTNDAVDERQFYIQLGVGAEQSDYDGQYVEPAKGNGRCDNQPTPGHGAVAAQRERCIVQIGKRGPATLQIGRALVSQTHRSGRPAEQRRAKRLFECGYGATGGGRGHSQPSCRFGEAHMVGNRDEGAQGLEAIHDYPDICMSEVLIEQIITVSGKWHF